MQYAPTVAPKRFFLFHRIARTRNIVKAQKIKTIITLGAPMGKTQATFETMTTGQSQPLFHSFLGIPAKWGDFCAYLFLSIEGRNKNFNGPFREKNSSIFHSNFKRIIL